MKYTPTFPERFGSLADARRFMARFVQACNHEHHHTGIGLHTPVDVYDATYPSSHHQISSQLSGPRRHL